MKISREAFESWLANPVTEAVFKTCIQNAEDNKEHCTNSFWKSGKINEIELCTLRVRAASMLELSEFEYGDLLDELRLEDEQRKTA